MPENQASPGRQVETSAVGCLLRVFWMAPGNAIPLYAAVWIAKNKTPWFSVPDWVFWIGITILIASRFAEIRCFQGTTAEGEPATLAHWRRYAIFVLAGGCIAWFAAHAFALS